MGLEGVVAAGVLDGGMDDAGEDWDAWEAGTPSLIAVIVAGVVELVRRLCVHAL